MSATERVNDTHGCGAYNTGGSPTVYINRRRAHRLGDSDSHGATMIEGSPTVFVNGRGLCRIGDLNSTHGTHRPSPQTTGSPNVFADDNHA